MSPRTGAVAALILAAGASSRMGEPKALLDWGGKPLLQHQIHELTAAGCEPVHVVLGHEAQRIKESVCCPEPCRLLLNAQYMAGRASSVRAGAATLPDDAAAVVIASVDTPCRATTVRTLIQAWRAGDAAIVVPRREGRNGHPAVFDGALLPELRAVEERHEGLRAVRRAHVQATQFLGMDDPLVGLDLNTPEDYEAARP